LKTINKTRSFILKQYLSTNAAASRLIKEQGALSKKKILFGEQK